MKKFFMAFVLLAVIILPTAYLEAAPRVAVIPFDNQSARQNNPSVDSILEQARSNVEIDIVQTGKFDPLDRTQINKLLDEIKFDHSALVDPATAAQYGKMVGAQYLVLGTVTGLTSKGNEMIAHLSLRMIEVETARIFLAGRGSGKSKGDMSEAMEKAAEDALTGKRGMLTMMRGGGRNS